jgi:murein L,D-transpeptidase YafK
VNRVAPALKAELQAKGMQFGSPIFIRVFKQSRELEVWVENAGGFRLFKTHEICTFSGELGPKLRAGDRQSPEGFYFVNPGRMNPSSRFHLSFNLGYPNAYDRAHNRTGSALMVHGNCVSIGCYAMTDKRIEEIYALAEAALAKGQPLFRVHVFPFRMTSENLDRHKGSTWYDFWMNLKGGFDFFERTGRPPNVEVKNQLYVFGPSS